MQRHIESNIKLQNQLVDYTLRVSPRARQLRLSVYPGGALVVTVPRFTLPGQAERFLQQKAHWILEKINYLKSYSPVPRVRRSKTDYVKRKAQALKIANQKVIEWNHHYGFTYGRITIRNQRSRWGSCSKKGNLNFNYKIALLPESLTDYIIVHELCHLKEFNHSRAFWALVVETIPDYKVRRQELQRSGQIFWVVAFFLQRLV